MTAKLDLTPEQRLKRTQRLSADRSATYYEKKKDIILQRRKDKRALLRAQKQESEPVIETNPVIETAQHPPIVFDFSAHIVNDDEDVKKLNQQISSVIDETPKFNLAESIAKLQQLGMKDQNLKTYVNSIKQLMRITECTDLVDCLKDSDKIINLIENGKKKNGSGAYATNSKIGLYQVIVYIIDAFKLDINKEPYNKQRLLLKIKDETRVEENQQKLVPTWEEALDKIKSKYGPISKEYVMMSLYKRIPARDDFQLLITDKLDGYDTNINYLVLRFGKPSKVILHHFKTADKYSKASFVLSPELSQLVNDYRIKNKIYVNQYLFGNMPQTGFVSKTLKDVGYGDREIYNQTGISFLRKTTVSNTPIDTPEQKLALANTMAHSTNTQKKYKSKLDKKK
jgi:hypothetical protein